MFRDSIGGLDEEKLQLAVRSNVGGKDSVGKSYHLPDLLQLVCGSVVGPTERCCVPHSGRHGVGFHSLQTVFSEMLLL